MLNGKLIDTGNSGHKTQKEDQQNIKNTTQKTGHRVRLKLD